MACEEVEVDAIYSKSVLAERTNGGVYDANGSLCV